MPEGAKKTLLLVEDEAIIAMTEKKALEHYGYAVKTASSGEKAVEVLDTIPGIDLVLMDIDLGNGIDGTQAAGIMLKDHDIPIVFVSSHSEREIVEKTEKITSYGYVVKNSSITVLDASIKMAFKLFDARNSLQQKMESMKATDDRFQLAMNELDGTFWALDLNLRFTLSRGRGLVGLGLQADQVIGMELAEFLQTDDPENVSMAAHRRALLGENVNYEYMYNGHTFRTAVSPLRDVGGRIIGVAGIGTDVSERVKALSALQEKNEEYEAINEELRAASGARKAQNRELIRSQELLRQNETRLLQAERVAKIGHWTLLLDTKTMVASNGADGIYGVDFQRIPLAEVQKIPLAEYRPLLDKALSGLVAGGIPYDLEFKIKRPDDGRVVDIHSVATFDKDANTVFGVIQDITERKKAEADSESQRVLMAMIMDTSPVGIATVDAAGGITYANYRAERILGIEKSEITERKYNAPTWNATDAGGGPYPDELQPFNIVKSTGRSAYDIRHGIAWPDGRCVFLSVNASPMLDEAGGFNGMVATFEDITERMRNEKTIATQLEEKKLLLKEVHHRIKNNLNTVGSLLSLQAQMQKEPSAITVLEDAGNRIQSMSLLYDKLYRSTDFTNVSVREYLPALVDEVIANFPNSESVKVVKHLDDFLLDFKRMQPLGIIINELLTNSMKYAFKGRNEGLITVSAAVAEGHVAVSVQDNGCGIHESVSFENSAGFGLQLVRALTQQLGGTIRIERGSGAKVILEFAL